MKTRILAWACLLTTGLAACANEDNLFVGHDGATGTGGGVGGGTVVASTGGNSAKGGAIGSGGSPSPGSGGTIVVGAGGAGAGGIAGASGGGISGSGGLATAGSGGRGSGGAVVGVGGSGAGAGGNGGTNKDGGVADTPNDAPIRTDVADAADGVVECAPGYPVGSTKPAGDGCNTCTCTAGGYFLCTTAACPPSDAALEAGQCPSGLVWCPGCTPGTGSCGQVCTGAPCPVGDAAVVDTGSGCSGLTTQAACDARSDCHSVFYDPGTCGCASAGCCAHFNRCVDGGKALCAPPTSIGCDMATPFCESPYVVSYTAICYEGCVLGTKCGP
jgi:hypothetical protein